MPKVSRKISVLIALCILMALNCIIAVSSIVTSVDIVAQLALDVGFIALFFIVGELLCARIINSVNQLKKRFLSLACIGVAIVIVVLDFALESASGMIMASVFDSAKSIEILVTIVAFISALIRMSIRYVFFAQIFRLFYGKAKTDRTWAWLCVVGIVLIAMANATVSAVTVIRLMNIELGTLLSYVSLLGNKTGLLLNGIIECAPMIIFAAMIDDKDIVDE